MPCPMMEEGSQCPGFENLGLFCNPAFIFTDGRNGRRIETAKNSSGFRLSIDVYRLTREVYFETAILKDLCADLGLLTTWYRTRSDQDGYFLLPGKPLDEASREEKGCRGSVSECPLGGSARVELKAGLTGLFFENKEGTVEASIYPALDRIF